MAATWRSFTASATCPAPRSAGPGHEIVARIVDIDHQLTSAWSRASGGDRRGAVGRAPPGLRGDGHGRARRDGLWGGDESIQLFACTKLHRFETDAPSQRLTVFEPLANAVNWVDSVEVGLDDVAVVLGPGTRDSLSSRHFGSQASRPW